VLALARVDGVSAVVLGQDRHAAPLDPAAFRLARRGMRLARELALPLVTLIAETQGISAPALLRDGLLSAVVPQRPDDTTRTLARALLAEARAIHRSVPG
jgi:hypothetical protein